MVALWWRDLLVGCTLVEGFVCSTVVKGGGGWLYFGGRVCLLYFGMGLVGCNLVGGLVGCTLVGHWLVVLR